MEVILLERIESLGQMGDVVNVKPGFARNYLLPQRKAMRATKANLERFEGRRAELEAQNLSRRQEAEAAAGKLEGLSLVLIRSAGESGQLYGSVSARDVMAGLAEQGVTVERRQVELPAPIKTLGLHQARVRLHPEVAVEISLNVAQSEDEAQRQTAAAEEPAEGAAAPAAEAVVEAAEEVAEAALTEEVAEEFFEKPESVAGDDDDGDDEAEGDAEAAESEDESSA